MVGTGGVNAMFIRNDFPEFGTNLFVVVCVSFCVLHLKLLAPYLVTTLASLEMDDFTHFWCKRELQRG